MNSLDLDCWQHKLGMIEGCLRAYSAPQEVMAALAWMKQNVEGADDQPSGDLNLQSMVTESMVTKAEKRQFKPAAEPIPLTPSSEEMATRARGYTPDEEALIIKMLREGASIATIADHFPKKSYQVIYAKVTALKSKGRV